MKRATYCNNHRSITTDNVILYCIRFREQRDTCRNNRAEIILNHVDHMRFSNNGNPKPLCRSNRPVVVYFLLLTLIIHHNGLNTGLPVTWRVTFPDKEDKSYKINKIYYYRLPFYSSRNRFFFYEPFDFFFFFKLLFYCRAAIRSFYSHLSNNLIVQRVCARHFHRARRNIEERTKTISCYLRLLGEVFVRRF